MGKTGFIKNRIPHAIMIAFCVYHSKQGKETISCFPTLCSDKKDDMELSLLRSHHVVLGKEGIPLELAHSLVKQGSYHDANLRHGYGDDQVLKEIRRRERALGHLSQEQIKLRIAVDFCCIWRYDYPQRVHDICSLIGGKPSRGLRLHYQICSDRRSLLIAYGEALTGWLKDKSITDYNEEIKSVAAKVYEYLGSRDPLKDMLVERTYLGISRRALNCSFWGYDSFSDKTPLMPFHAGRVGPETSARMKELEQKIVKEMGDLAGDFLCDVGGSAEPACHFKFIRRIDILISSIGCLRWRGNFPPKDKMVSGRRRITQLYLDVLESYWNGIERPLGADGDRIRNEIFERLGKPDDVKRWLAACLWKNIYDQTTYHAYPMRQWVEFVRIGERYLEQLEGR